MDRAQLHWLTATEAARLMADGALSSEDYVRACIERIDAVEEQVQVGTNDQYEARCRKCFRPEVIGQESIPSPTAGGNSQGES